jgi:hypothetical protein
MIALLVTALLAGVWFVGGYAATAAFFYALPAPASVWPLACGAANTVVGLGLLLIATYSKRGWRLFYGERREEEPISLLIAALWALPLAQLFAAFIWWIIGRFLTTTK